LTSRTDDRTSSPRLSLIVIARDEESSIRRCLRSVDIADEMIVVENGSTDRTREVASSCGAKVISTRDWPGFGPQKNRALDAASGDWVLSLDADEWIEPPLAAELQSSILRADDAIHGYEIPRRSRYCGAIVRYSGWWPDYTVRLFRKGNGHFTNDLVHERIVIDGRTGRLLNPIQHEPIIDASEADEKINLYADLMATQLAKDGRTSKAAGWPFLHASFAFFRTYVLQMGFLDGKVGWKIADYNRRYTLRKWKALRAIGP